MLQRPKMITIAFFARKRALIAIQCHGVLLSVSSVIWYGNVDPLFCPSVLLPICYTAHLTYDSCLFLYYLRVRLRQFLGRALRLGRASGPSAAAKTGWGPGAAARSPSSSCKTTCQQVGWAVGRMGVGPKILISC